MTNERSRRGVAHKLAWASIATGALSWAPMARLLIEDYFDAPPSGEIQGMALMAAVFFGLVILGGGALVGTVLAVVALWRPPRGRAAWAGLGLNAMTLVGIVGLAVWMLFLQ